MNTATISSQSSFSTILINPSTEELIQAIHTAEQKANYLARSRKVSVNVSEISIAVKTAPAGNYTYTGGGVCNSYQYRADSSIFGVAWYCADDGSLYVRIKGARVTAPKSSFASREPRVWELCARNLAKMTTLEQAAAIIAAGKQLAQVA